MPHWMSFSQHIPEYCIIVCILCLVTSASLISLYGQLSESDTGHLNYFFKHTGGSGGLLVIFTM